MRFLALIVLIATGVASAGEYAVFQSGSTLHVDRHEPDGAKIRLFSGDGYIEMDASLVQRFEPDPGGLLAATPAQPTTPAEKVQSASPEPSPEELADAAADRYGLDRRLLRILMSVESGFQPRAVSPKGAIGLMQLMPSTALALGADPHDPAQNVDAGARYLRDLVIKYDGGLRHVLAAYNAGEGAVDKYKGVPPFPETIEYIRRIERQYLK